MDELSLHHSRIESLKEALKKQKSGTSPLSMTLHKKRSNTTNKRSYKHSKAHLNISSLCNILKIDADQRRAFVEPKVTMYELAKNTLKAGFLPQVVPEFKSITVGGAIIGGATESSGHKYGLFHEICPKVSVLLGNGEVIQAASDVHSDLYHALSGSYGSLGTVVQAEISLAPAPKAIKVSYHTFYDANEAIGYIKERALQKSHPEFLDGIIFSKDLAVVMEGDFSDHSMITYNPSFFSPWFYQHVKEIARKKTAAVEYLTPIDYLFRYDQGAFWMGAYVLKPALFLRLLTEGLTQSTSSETLLPFNENEIEKFSQIQGKPNLLQSIFGPLLSSECLYKLLHKAEKWVESKVIIQDFCIPFQRAENFFKTIQDTAGIYPLWLCPLRKAKNAQIFSPHSTSTNDTHYLNFGIYGLARHASPTREITKILEGEAKSLAGRKVLYSYSYYSEDEFWQIYPKKAYEELRKKYHAENTWMSIEQKML